MSQELTPFQEISPLMQLGQTANAYASINVFGDYRQRLDPNTLERQRYDLAVFSLYLADAGVAVGADALYGKPEAWQGVTHGLVKGFVQWMLLDGLSIGSINVRLSTVRSYARCAAQADMIPARELAFIELVKGFGYAEGENVNEQRVKTRKGAKKATPTLLAPEQIRTLKTQPDTKQGRRDALLMCLLLDHGLRCGEVADLTVADLQVKSGILTFRREKVKKVQKHKLTADTLVAALRYLEVCTPGDTLLMGSRKGHDGDALAGSMGRRAITRRVNVLGKRLLTIQTLSAHDCRHAWVESAIRGKTDIKALQDAGGWSSPAMPLKYASSSEIANEGVKLG